jgi:hypothetical protein
MRATGNQKSPRARHSNSGAQKKPGKVDEAMPGQPGNETYQLKPSRPLNFSRFQRWPRCASLRPRSEISLWCCLKSELGAQDLLTESQNG